MVPALAESASAGTPPRARWRDLAPRVASALVMAPLGLAAIVAGGLIWQVVLTALGLITMLEWASVCGARPRSELALFSVLAVLLGWAGMAALSFWADGAIGPFPAGLAADAAPFLVLALAAFWQLPSRRAVALGTIYVGFGWAALLILRQGAGGLGLVLFIMLVVWSNDIGAYVIGRSFGGPRLAPALSPGKTWAGALGGIALGVVGGLGVVAALGASRPHPGYADAAAQALVLAIAAQSGDLLESAIKRRFGKKDSGSLIPGHGGLLDRVDGLLAAATGAVLLRLAAFGLYGVDAWQ